MHNFQPKIEDVEEHADRATGERLLGVDPKIWAKMFTLEWKIWCDDSNWGK